MSWTKQTKASDGGGTTTIDIGTPIGILLSITYAEAQSFTSGGWTQVGTVVDSWVKQDAVSDIWVVV
jgi:hypothetical protein